MQVSHQCCDKRFTMAPPPKVTLEHQAKIVQVSYSVDAFSFKDFDYYARRKFGLMDSSVIRYCTEEGEWDDDVLPTAALLKDVSKIRVVCDTDHIGTVNGNDSSYNKYTPVNIAHRMNSLTPSSATAAHTAVVRSGTKSNTMNSHSRMGTPAGNDDDDAAADDYDNDKDNANDKDNGEGREDDVCCPSTQDKRAEPFTPKVTDRGSGGGDGKFQQQQTMSKNGSTAAAAAAISATVSSKNNKNKGSGVLAKGGSLIYGISSTMNMLDYTFVLPYVISILLAVLLTPKWVNGSAISKIFDYLDTLAISCGLPSGGISHTEWRTLFMEVFVTFVVRCFTELFIRRALNPENDMKKVLQKFSVDSIFAGLGAGSFVILRKLAVHNSQ